MPYSVQALMKAVKSLNQCSKQLKLRKQSLVQAASVNVSQVAHFQTVDAHGAEDSLLPVSKLMVK